MSTQPKIERIIRSLPSHHNSRSTAFRSLYTKGEFTLDLYTVDRLLQQNDHELVVEVICLMLDYLNCEDRDAVYPSGCTASYNAIINRLGINKGAIEINQEYLVPLLALLPDGGMAASGYPCRKELADMVYVLRQRTNWTSEEFSLAMQTTSWQGAYTDFSELYALNVSSDLRIENLHYGKLFETLFYRPAGIPATSNTSDEKTEEDDEEKVNEDEEAAAEEEEKQEDEDEDADAETVNEGEANEEEVDIIDPINEDVSAYNRQESLGEFLLWIGFKNAETTSELMLSNQESQISQFLGMSYYHAVCAILGVVFSLVQKQQRHLNFRIIYMFHDWFFVQPFPVPTIISDYETPILKDVEETRASQVFFLSYEKRLREMNQFDPNQPEHDIGVTKRVQNLPFITETKLMFTSSMMEASIYNGGTHINATYGYSKFLDGKRDELAAIKEELDNAEENGLDVEEVQEKFDELSHDVDTRERYAALLDRFHEAMYNTFNTKFSSYTCIIVAWIISMSEGDETSRNIIEKYFGVNIDNWNDYDAEAYYSSLQTTGAESQADCGLDFSWATQDFCTNSLEPARVMLYNLSKPCSDYDDLLYRILAQLIMIDHIDGIDWVMKQLDKTSLQDVTNTVIYGRLSLFAFATQLDESSLDTTKALVKRKAKVVVNAQFSEGSNIFVSAFCSPHLSDDQVLDIFEYWQGFCQRNPKSNQMHINIYELYSMLNRAWAFRYTRATRVNSLGFLTNKILPPTTIEKLVSTPEPNFLQALFTTFTAQSSYSDDAPNGNTSSRYGDFACIAYEQELLGLIYSMLFPTLGHLSKALQLFQTPTSLFTPVFAHQSKKAFDHIFFNLKFPVRLEIIAVMINSMLPCVDWSSCVDVQSIVLQYQQWLFQQQNKPAKKKLKKGTKKGAAGKGKKGTVTPVADEETEVTTPVVTKQPPADTYEISAESLRSTDTQFCSYTNSTMLNSMRQLEVNTMMQYDTLVKSELQEDVKKQQAYVQEFNQNIETTYGQTVLSPGNNKNNSTPVEAIAIRPENKHSVEFFNDDKNIVKVDNAIFTTWRDNILTPYKSTLLAPHNVDGTLGKDDLDALSNDFEELFNTVLKPNIPPVATISSKYDLLAMDTTVLDALIWFSDKNEKMVAEDYGGCEISYGFVLYAMAALLTLFNQLAATTVTDNQDDDETPARQLTKLYLALFTTMGTPQGAVVGQIFQLLFKPTNPFPMAYQNCLSRISNEQLRHFYSPWVHTLYSQYGNTRTLAQLAIDLERQVQESPQGRRLFPTQDEKINAKVTWSLEQVEVEYTPTPLFQIILTTIMSECLSQSYMVGFQQHYPQRLQYTKSLMLAQHQREQQASPYCTHTHKFNGLAGITHLVTLFNQVSFIPTHIPYVLFGLLPALDITTTIAANPDLENVQQVWKFYATQRIKRNPTNPQIAFLSHGTHQSWMVDTLDIIMSRSSLSNNNLTLLDNLVNPPSDQSLEVTAFNPLINSLINYSQLFTPISQINEILTMNYWAQLTHTFGSLATQCDKFFLLAPQTQTAHDDKSILGDFDTKTQFTLVSTDPIFVQGLAGLYNKYLGSNSSDKTVTPEQFQQTLYTQLLSMTHAVTLHEEQADDLAKVEEDVLAKFDIENVIKGVVPEKPKPEVKPTAFSMSKMLPPSTSASIANPKKSNATTPAATAQANKEPENNTTTPQQEPQPPQQEPQQEPEQILQSETTTTQTTPPPSSGMAAVLAMGAVAGLLGAAIYAGLTYFQAQRSVANRDGDDDDDYEDDDNGAE